MPPVRMRDQRDAAPARAVRAERRRRAADDLLDARRSSPRCATRPAGRCRACRYGRPTSPASGERGCGRGGVPAGASATWPRVALGGRGGVGAGPVRRPGRDGRGVRRPSSARPLPNDQLALIRAHPDLAGRAALAGELTPESAGEQASAGLDRLTPADLERVTRLNDGLPGAVRLPVRDLRRGAAARRRSSTRTRRASATTAKRSGPPPSRRSRRSSRCGWPMSHEPRRLRRWNPPVRSASGPEPTRGQDMFAVPCGASVTGSR